MNINDLRPVGNLAQKFGVKSLVYGPPGSGKTPLLNTAPRPLCLVVEPGLLSVRNLTFPAYAAHTAERIREFFEWFFKSKEAAQFDTLGIDSVSQIAEILATYWLEKKKDGRAAYGEMARECLDWFSQLFYMPNKHIYLIAKQHIDDVNNVKVKLPYFPGKELNVRVPHMYDEILHLDRQLIKGVAGNPLALRCQPSFDTSARDRSGKLNEFEPPDLNALFTKCMS